MAFIESSGGGYTRSDDPGEKTYRKPRISISDAEARILSRYAFDAYVFEIGTGIGVSTRAFAARAFHVWTVDIDPWVQETIWPELAELGNVSCVTHLNDVGRKPDIVFIDADHSTVAVRRDIQYAAELLQGSGLIVAHDANYVNVKRALVGEWGKDWALLPTEHGLGVRVVR